MVEKKGQWLWSQQIKIIFLPVLLTVYYVTFHFDPTSYLKKTKPNEVLRTYYELNICVPKKFICGSPKHLCNGL